MRGFQTRNIPLLKKAVTTYKRIYVHCWNIIPIFGVRRRLILLTWLKMSSVAWRSVLRHYRNYLQRLTVFDLRSLRYDMIQYYKILNNLTSLNPADHFKLHFSFASARDPSTTIVRPIRLTDKVLSGCFSIDALTVGTACHRMFEIVTMIVSWYSSVFKIHTLIHSKLPQYKQCDQEIYIRTDVSSNSRWRGPPLFVEI